MGSEASKTVVRGTAIAFVGRIAGMAAQFLHSLIVARMLGSGALGLFSLAFTLASILSTFMKLGLDTGGMKSISAGLVNNEYGVIKGTLRGALVLFVAGAASFGLLFMLIAEPLLDWLKMGQVKEYAYLIVVTAIAFGALTLFIEWLRAFKMIKTISVLQHLLIYLLAGLLVVAFLPWWQSNEGLLAILTAMLAIIVALSVAIVILLRRLPDMSAVQPSGQMSCLLRASFPLMFINLTWNVLTWTDVLMLGFYLTPEDVGVYTVALRLATCTSLFLMAVNAIMPPVISDLYQKGQLIELEALIRKSSRALLATTLSATLVLLFFGDVFLNWFGASFVASGILPLVILAAGRTVGAAAGSVGYVLIMSNHHATLSYVTVACGALNVTLNIVFIPMWGLMGAAIASASTTIVWNLLACWIAWRRLAMITWSDRLIQNTVAGGGGIMVYNLLLPMTGQIISAIIALAIYFFVIVRWVTDISELKELLSLRRGDAQSA